MPYKRTQIIFGSLLAICCASSAWAWNPAGHMSIASVAYDELTPARRAALVALLKQHPRFDPDFASAMPPGLSPEQQNHWIFMRAAVWPDLARNFTGTDLATYSRPIWHYLDIPVFLDEKAQQSVHPHYELDYHKATVEPTMNAVQAIHKNLDDLNNPATPIPAKAVALCWVLHLAGDLHQPLHGAALFSAVRFRQLPAGDRGGNEIHVHEREGLLASFKTPNLHALWDCILGLDDSYPAVLSLAEKLKSQRQFVQSDRQKLEPADWAQESNAVAKQSAYTSEILALVTAGEADARQPLPIFEITDEYMKSARAVALRRAEVAGLRTATLLEAKP
jgi:hypothetical protein